MSRLFCLFCLSLFVFFFFFNDTATTEIYTLSLHDALPICGHLGALRPRRAPLRSAHGRGSKRCRSEEHTSELQSRLHLVCRLLLEKKKKQSPNRKHIREQVRTDVRRDRQRNMTDERPTQST